MDYKLKPESAEDYKPKPGPAVDHDVSIFIVWSSERPGWDLIAFNCCWG